MSRARSIPIAMQKSTVRIEAATSIEDLFERLEKKLEQYNGQLLRSAVERGIEIISEASRHLGRDLKAQHKDVRWKDIAGIGNILRHDYQRVINAYRSIYSFGSGYE